MFVHLFYENCYRMQKMENNILTQPNDFRVIQLKKKK